MGVVDATKPPYAVPTMDEIRAMPTNGLWCVSTFTGCGGSCLGFRQAGFQTAYASEFVPLAAETYRANFPDTHLDTRDIRTVTGAEILRVYRERSDRDEVDVLEGSPPCASFSTAGKREAGWGTERAYSGTKQRVDDLFFEFIRILGELRPRAFAAENVTGLVIGRAKGYFKEIVAGLSAQGYRVSTALIDAQWLGVPQRRKRVFLVGVRDDIDGRFEFPSPLPYRYTLRDVLPGLRITSGKGRVSPYEPAPTVLTHGNLETRSELAVEIDPERIVQDFTGTALGREYDKLDQGEVSRKYLNLIRASMHDPSPTVTAMGGASAGTAAVVHPTDKRKFTIPELRAICSFPPDFVLTGTFSQRWERLGRAVPPPMARAVAAKLAEALA